MTDIKEIRTHIRSMEQALKIASAMYPISSSSLRKTRRQSTDVKPCFSKIEATISDILHHSPKIDHRFLDKRPGILPGKRKTGSIVIAGDKGLAGAYSHNTLKLTEEKMSRTANPSLFVAGQVGRSYFLEHGIPIDVESLYTTQDPNMGWARDMAELMLDLYLDGQLDEVHVLSTKTVSSFQVEPTTHKLLPLDPDVFPEHGRNWDSCNRDVVYVPSVKVVMNQLVFGYIREDLFDVLMKPYCSEQNARMTVVKSSGDNVRAMFQRLNLSFSRARQTAITQEVTEAVDGTQATL